MSNYYRTSDILQFCLRSWADYIVFVKNEITKERKKHFSVMLTRLDYSCRVIMTDQFIFGGSFQKDKKEQLHKVVKKKYNEILHNQL